jgi:hypothetical protein
MRKHAAALATTLALLATACGSDEPVVCDPLLAQPQPIALGAVLGAGRDPAGVLYVVDTTATDEHRLFVQDAAGLARQRIAGSGETTDVGGTSYTFAVTDIDPPLHLKIEVSTAGAVRMGVVRGPFDERGFTIGAQGDVLVVVEPAAVQGLPLRNLDGAMTVEYVAELEDGRQLIVVRPTDDWNYDDFRVFLGPPEGLLERKVHSVLRARDGGTTHILFDLDGTEADALFPATVGPRSEASIKTKDDRFPLTLRPSSPLPEGVSFRCP